MKISGTGRNQGVGKTQKTSKKSSVSGAEFNQMLSGTEEASSSAAMTSTSAASPAAQIDALLAAQQTSDATSEEARKRATQRAETILDQLELLRIGMMTGVVPIQHLQDLTKVVASHRDAVEDPMLRDILSEIDLRAQVELAKLSNIRA